MHSIYKKNDMNIKLPPSSIIPYCLLCFLFTLCSTTLWGQRKNVAEQYDIDSTLYKYYLQCKAEWNSPAVMQKADTLFQMASKLKDTRMQAVALCTKLDYHYFKGANNEDSVSYYVELVKKFAKGTNQPKYYYFAWSKRLINYHIKFRHLNMALYEANKMMKEAEQEEYPAGIANGYNILSSIYQTKGLYKLAAEAREKEIDIILKYNVDTYNLSNTSSMLGYLYAQLQETGKAEKYLKLAEEHLNSPIQEFQLYLRYAEYYLSLEDCPKAKEALDKAKQLIDTQKEVKRVSSEYYLKLKKYYIFIRQFDKALAIREYITQNYPDKDLKLEQMLEDAFIFSQLGNHSKAIKYYQTYVQCIDSLYKANEDIAAGEFAAMLGVERLNAEKIELQQEMQQRDLRSKQRIIFCLIALLVLGFIIFYREHLLNGRLRLSQNQLSEKNNQLLLSQAELFKAKEKAEKASLMKSEFIQNMSHEIRTPLNSIVGFSQIISSMNQTDEEAKEYAGIIEQGSNNLLQLVQDVLDISSLDSETDIPATMKAEATSLCHECMAQAGSLKPGVSLSLQTEQDEFYFLTSPQHLSQILSHLLRNAAKFTLEGQITLAWHTDKEKKNILFSVTDTGVGIPADKKEFIFERFAKVDTFAQGTGLGLPIARLRAEKMGGGLTLDPDYTNGSRFVLALPLV